MNVEIKPLGSVPHLVAAVAAAITAHNRLADPVRPHAVHRDACFYAVATDGPNLAGCIRIDRVQWYQAEIRHLCVLPEYRRYGLGQRLLEHALEIARQGDHRIAQCTIRDDNPVMQRLAQRVGFEYRTWFKSGSHTVQIYSRGIQQ